MTFKILGGEFKGRLLQSPDSKTTRPTQGIVRQAVFNICQGQIEGASFLDLFSGSGAMGLEARSRGAKRVIVVEKDKQASRCIEENIRRMGVHSSVELIKRDVSIALKELFHRSLAFDLVYIDPPYGLSVVPVLEKLQSYALLVSGGTVFVEDSSQSAESTYSTKTLCKIDSRSFGTARLSQFQYTCG